MQKASLVCVLAIALAGCGNGGEGADTKQPAFELQPIGYPEMTSNHIKRDGCAFIPEGGGLGTLFIAAGKDAFIKSERKIIKLAADEASPRLPANAWEKYTGEGHIVSLTVSGEGRPRANGKSDYTGQLAVHDAAGKVQYESAGMAECGT